jgi:ribonuclease HI
MKEITIYTDGACSRNPGKGGWGAILLYNNHKKKLSGFKPLTTNNQMELTAIIKAIEALKEKCKIDLYTDSQYVKKGITEWIENWIKKGWKTSNKKPVKNTELWKNLYELSKKHDITWHWIKGHAGNKYNEIADTLATNEIRKHMISEKK